MNGGVSKMIFRLITLLWLLHPVFTLCSKGCSSCRDEGLQSICDRCDRGFWLSYPNCVPCPSNCETCTDDYTCQSCKPQFYCIGTQKTCQYDCSSNCTPLGCADETGDCKECPSGWYGPECGEDCNLCRSGLCDLRKCSNGCKDGYVQDDVNPSNIYCRPCVKSNCMTCSNTTYCTQCNDGYYVRPYITSSGRGEADCQPCSSDHTCGNCESILNCKICYRDNEKLKCSEDVSTTTTTTTIATTKINIFTSFDNVTTSGETSTTQITHGKATTAVVQTVSECRESLGPAIGGSIAGGCVFGVLASAIVFYIFLRQRSLRKESDRKQRTNVYYNMSMSAVHDEESQADRNLARKDLEVVSSSNKCEATLYEKLAYQSKGNLYDHLDQSSAKEILQEVGELGSSPDYYNK